MISPATLHKITRIAIGNLATLALSAGIIALFAHNWDDFPKAVRLILSFIPVLLGVGVFAYSEIKKGESVVWMECSSLFLAFMIGSTMGLVTQVYNMGGSLEDFLFVWLVIILPIIYIGRSTSTAIFYLLLSLVWLYLTFFSSFNIFRMGSSAGDDVLWFWVFFIGIIPHFLIYVKPGQITYRGTVLGWAMGIAMVYGAGLAFTGHILINSMLLTMLVYTVGKEYYGNGKSFWFRPFQSLGIYAVVTMAIAYSSKGLLQYMLEKDGYLDRDVPEFMSEFWQGAGEPSHEWIYYLNYVLMFAMAFLFGKLFWDQYNRNKENLNYGIFAFPAALILAILFALPEWDKLPRIILNLYLFGLAGWYLWQGITHKMGQLIFFGVVVFAVTMLVRYFDMSIAFWLKGLIYIGVGVGFLYFNDYYSKKIEE